MSLSASANQEIQWRVTNIETSKGPIQIKEPSLIIKSDASLKAWGAFCEGVRTGGPWSVHEISLYHINELELLAAFLALKSFANEKDSIHVRIFVDNTVAMNCINKMGSMKSEKLNELTKNIWEWCMPKNIWVSAARIAGKDNVEADHESRNVNLDTEWQLDPSIFHSMVKIIKWVPDIDLFASRLNNQCTQYVSYRPDPGAIAVDAFSLSWTALRFFAFPPFCLLTRVLQKLYRDKATGIVVAPFWATQAFFPVLMKMLIDIPILISSRRNLLSLPSWPEKLHPLHKQLKMIACLVSGDDSKTRGFHQTQQSWSCPHGDRRRRKLMQLTSKDGNYLRLGTKWIRCRRL